MAELGLGVEKDNPKALEWYRRGAEQGNALAQANAARLLGFNTPGVKLDKIEAYKWMSLSAERNEPAATNAFAMFQKTLTPEELAEGRRQADDYKLRKAGAANPKN